MEAPKSNSKDKNIKYWLRRTLIVFAFLLLVPLGLSIVGWLNRETIIEVIQNWYNLNHTGTLSIGEVNSSSFRNFPKIGFTIKDIKQTGFDSISDKQSTMSIDRAHLVLSAQDLILGNIAFEKIEIEDAKFESWLKPTRTIDYYINLKTQKQQGITSDIKFPDWLEESGILYSLKNVRYISRDTLLNKHFDLLINNVDGYYSNLEEEIHGALSMDIFVKALGFNTKKGSFFRNQRVQGNPVFYYSKQRKIMEVEEFDLKIENQIFKLISFFDFNTGIQYEFSLKNDETDLKGIKQILTDTIASKISAYDFINPFKSNLSLMGSFGYGSNPEINAEFKSSSNKIKIIDKYTVNDATFSGYLTTDIYNHDSIKNQKKSRKDLKIVFDSLTGTIDGISVSLDKSSFQSSSEALNYIDANINLNGNNDALADLIDTSNFDFNGGQFNLDIELNGDVDDPRKLLEYANGSLNLNNTRVVLKKNGLQLPIRNIDLKLLNGNASLRELSVILSDGSSFDLTGTIKNLSGILYNTSISETKTNTKLTSEFLNLNSLIETAREFAPKSNSIARERKDLNEIFEAIYNRFHPSFEIQLDSIIYKDYVLKDINAEFGFMDSESIFFNRFQFSYLDAKASLNGIVVVPKVIGDKTNPIFLDIDLNSTGEITLFENIFDVSLFDIESGDYIFDGNINGNVKEMPELLSNAKGLFKLNNTVLHYNPADISIELDSMNLYIEQSTAYLENFEIELDTLSPISLSGKIIDFPSFMLKEIQARGSMSAKVYSPYIDTDRLFDMVSALKANSKSKDSSKQKALYSIFKDINGFKPEIEIIIDSLKYRGLITKNLKANALFENDSTVSLKNFEIRYKNTDAKISGEFNAIRRTNSDKNTSPFSFNFSIDVAGNSKDLNDYLKTTNFQFNSGSFTFNGEYHGESKSLTFTNTETYGDLKLGPSLVTYKPADISIPLDSLYIQIDNDIASLKTLDLNLPGKSSIDFSGSITNFSSFINDSSNQSQHTSRINIVSPYLDTKDIKTFLNASDSKVKDSITQNLQTEKIRQSLMGIKNSFMPVINVGIDSLIHDNLIINNVGTKLLFDNEGNFKIENTELNYYGGDSQLSAVITLSDEGKLPIDLNIQSKDLDLLEIIKGFNYFDDEDLRNAEKIEGRLDQMIDVKGKLNENGELNLNSLNGTIKIEIYDMAIFNYKPIMDNVVLLKDERFKHLRFQPILLNFDIKNGEVLVPRTEIQSTALHFFIEGWIKMNDYINIWVSLPWNNLKSNDGLVLPDKTKYDEAGAKFYLQFIQDKDSKKARKRDLKVKFRLSNRKLRKEKAKQ